MGAIELGLVFGIVLALALWGLWSLRRDEAAARRAQERQPPDARE